MFFRRVDVYTELRPTNEITDLIVQIMAEVLSILGIATKEIKQGRMSKYFPCKCEIVEAEGGRSEKYAKKLIGRTGNGRCSEEAGRS